MRIEVLCTGDELLQGQATDTNSPFFMGKLFALGERVEQSQTVGDRPHQITAALRALAERADVALVSGGLGPTSDDLTAQSAAEAFGVRLVEDEGTLLKIRSRFENRGIAFTPNNARQALVPEGSQVVANPAGTAPMFIHRSGRCTFYFVPGVPREYMALVEREVLPRIAERLAQEPNRTFRAVRTLKTVGLPESHLDAKVEAIAKDHPNVYFGFRTTKAENHLKLIAQDSSLSAASAELARVESKCRQALGSSIFGADDDTLPQVVGKLLGERRQTVAVAESCTGGWVGELLTQPPGASEFFLGGAVTYQPQLKAKWARVKPEALADHGPVSREVALAMAEGIRAETHASWGLSVTGFAGPSGGTDADPLGTVYCAASSEGLSVCERYRFPGHRDRVRELAASAAVDLLRRQLEKEKT